MNSLLLTHVKAFRIYRVVSSSSPGPFTSTPTSKWRKQSRDLNAREVSFPEPVEFWPRATAW